MKKVGLFTWIFTATLFSVSPLTSLPAKADTSWVPSGFNAYNNKVAYKWSANNSYSCDAGSRCIQMEVVAKDGCGNLYAELTKLDNSGNNVGYTNETTTGLAAGQKAILKFEAYDEVSKFQVSKINCY